MKAIYSDDVCETREGSIAAAMKRHVDEKRSQWDQEAAISAARAIKSGKTACLVTYPSGLKMMRFAEPFREYGMHYEVSPETWASLNGTTEA